MAPVPPAPPTRCSGCSTRFPLMVNDGRRCGACQRRSSGLPTWPCCGQCGDPFEFLGSDGVCHDCIEYLGEGGASQVAQDAITKPANPRTHTSRGPEGDDQVEARKARAAEVVGHMASSHANNVARAAPGTRVASSKVKGGYNVNPTSASVPKAPRKLINLRVDKICNVGKGTKPGASPPNFVAQNFEIPEDTKMSDVLEKLVALADTEYTSAFNVRVYDATALIPMWVASKTEIDPSHFVGSGTLGDLWKAVSPNPNFVKSGDKSKHKLDIFILVKHDPNAEEDDDGFKVPAPKRPRAGSTQVHSTNAHPTTVARSKKPRISASGSMAYKTALPEATVVEYLVEKFNWGQSEKDGVTVTSWKKDPEMLYVEVDKASFAAGKTKQVYKMMIDGRAYAAKCFFNVGRGLYNVSAEENLKELRNELLRQCIAKKTVDNFVKQAQSLKISVYNLCIDNAFILIVTEGPNKGHAWLVDKLYQNAEGATHKYSGTDQAGANGLDVSLAGPTCDTFAHYSFFDSEETLVFVDIEGIDTALLPPGPGQKLERPRLVLFDLMVHSVGRDYGLGDNGQRGLDMFAQQHTCNPICHQFGLSPFKQGSGKAGPADPMASPTNSSLPDDSEGGIGKARGCLVDKSYASSL